MERVWLALGSNLGDRAGYLDAAIARLGSDEVLGGPIARSGLWESRARYYTEQPDFLNMVVRGDTALEPASLLAALQRIETDLGRLRDPGLPKGPRIIDIDILLYGSRIIVQDRLVVPHPGMRDRKFVLLPLLELDPELRDPVSGSRFAELLSILPAQGIYPWRASGYDAPYP